jgi:hypothetical protein
VLASGTTILYNKIRKLQQKTDGVVTVLNFLSNFLRGCTSSDIYEMEQDLKALQTDLKKESDAYKLYRLEKEINEYKSLIQKKKAQRKG